MTPYMASLGNNELMCKSEMLSLPQIYEKIAAGMDQEASKIPKSC